jgi:ABC-type spermidine/putrescine transport system permease subunit I
MKIYGVSSALLEGYVMRSENSFSRISWTVFLLLVLLPSAAVFLEILKAGFSQWNITNGGLINFPTLQSYLSALEWGRFHILLNQVGRALIVATIDLIIAVPTSHLLVRSLTSKRRLIVLVILMLPFFVNSATKAFSWKLILGSQGPVSAALGMVGVSETIRHSLLYNPWDVAISLVSSSLPLALFPIAAYMSAIPKNVWNLCEDMGLDCGNELMFVALPGAVRGATVGWIASFVICSLASHEIDFTGGINETSLSKVVDGLFSQRDPNAAMALGAVFLCAIAVSILIVRLVQWLCQRVRISKPLPFATRAVTLERFALVLTITVILVPALSVVCQTANMAIQPKSGVVAGLAVLTAMPVMDAVEHTIAVAILVTIPAVAGASVAALSVWNRKSFQTILIATLCLAAIPGDAYAMGVFYLARTLHLTIHPMFLIGFSEMAWVFPFIFLTIASGYIRIEDSVLDSARDLGGSSSSIFVLIIIPQCWPEIVLSGIVGVVLSSNDSSRATLLSNRYQVISEYIVGRLGSGNDISDYFLACSSVFLGLLVVTGFVICILHLYQNEEAGAELNLPSLVAGLDGPAA